MNTEHLHQETPISSLRNKLTPAYSIAKMVIELETVSFEKREKLIEIIIEQAKTCIDNQEGIDDILSKLTTKERAVEFAKDAYRTSLVDWVAKDAFEPKNFEDYIQQNKNKL